MRDSLLVLAISGALAFAAAVAPVSAQTESPTQDAGAAPAVSPAQSETPAQPASLMPPTGAPTHDAIPAADLKEAETGIRSSWHDYEKCSRSKMCTAYFESFGVGITFGDGTIVPFAHLQRLTASRHDCIQNARDALGHGNPGLAVQWVMASEMQEPLDRNWIGDHPDAVVEALGHILF